MLMAFIALMVAGLALLPFLQTGLEPTRVSNDISISYTWYNAAPQTIESEVTSQITEVCTTIPGIREIESFSEKNRGGLTLSFVENKNMDAARMEVSSMLRRVRAKLPEGIRDLKVAGGDLFSESEIILSYTIFSSFDEEEMSYFIEEKIKRPISLVEGVNDVEVSGLNRSRWEVYCAGKRLESLGLNIGDVRTAIRENYGESYLGKGGLPTGGEGQMLQVPVYLQYGSGDPDLGAISIVSGSGHPVLLADIADISKRTVHEYSTFRINGLSTLRASILSDKGANILQVGKAVEEIMDRLNRDLPEGYSIRKELDATEELKEELRHIYFRTALSFVILLLFISVVSRAPRYIFIVFFSLMATLAISVLFFFLFGVQINLYSLAGITVSFGIIIDNIIVMQDHLLLRKDLKAYPALLAATLTTIGALSVIFMLKEEVRLKLEGFASVFAITLGVSLFTALFLVPALTHLTGMENKGGHKVVSWKRLGGWMQFLEGFWATLSRRRGLVSLVLVLAFGLPVFMLPESVGEDLEQDELKWYHRWYMHTLGSDFYTNRLRKYLDPALGGTLRPFLEKREAGRYYFGRGNREHQEARLYIYGRMEMGSSPEMTDQVVASLERFLSTIDEIEIFSTEIRENLIQIQIEFREAFQFSHEPLGVKYKVIQECISLGAAVWRVFGSGDAFSNDRSFSNDVLGLIGYQSNRIELKGYDLGRLYKLAYWLKDRMEQHGRFQDVSVFSRIDIRTPLEFSYQLAPRIAYMQSSGLQASQILQRVRELSVGGELFDLYTGKGHEELLLSSDQAQNQDLWNMMHHSEVLGDRMVYIGELLDRRYEKANQTIRKEDGQYLLSVMYNFVGPDQLHGRIRDQILQEVEAQQPAGFSSAPKISRWGDWGSDDEIEGQLGLFLVLVLIIYFLCAILLNSLKQPLVVVFMIPVSFIGLFAGFAFFDIRMDNGIFAAFIFSSGLSVNAALYIINEFNSLKKMRPNARDMKLYLAAYRHKIMPILYTIVSTILGLMPFILINRNQEFWYSFAVGTMASCLFSLVGVFVFLPAYMGIRAQADRREGKGPSL